MNPRDNTDHALVAQIRFLLSAIADLEDLEDDESQQLTEECREEMGVLLAEYERRRLH